MAAVEQPRPAPRERLAIATVAHGSGVPALCGLVKWCQQAQRLAALVPVPAEVLLLTDSAGARAECSSARVVPFDTTLRRRIVAYLRDVRGLTGAHMTFMSNNLQKLQLLGLREYGALLFSDWDVDLVPDAALARAAWAEAFPTFMSGSGCRLQAAPDNSAPINSGLWLTRLAAAGCSEPYDIFLDWLRNGSDARWTPAGGFDAVGAPRALVGDVGTATRLRAARNQMWTHDNWSFFGGDVDQGFLFYAFAGRLRAWHEPRPRSDYYTARHWSGQGKPWVYPPRARSFMLQWGYYADLVLPRHAADAGAGNTTLAGLTACELDLLQKRGELRARRYKAQRLARARSRLRRLVEGAGVLAEGGADSDTAAHHGAFQELSDAWDPESGRHVRFFFAQPLL